MPSRSHERANVERRVLLVDLGALAPGERGEGPRPWSPNAAGTTDPAWAAQLPWIASWGGTALALALLLDAQRAGGSEEPLVVSVGEGVARGLPTAARAALTARVPLTGRLGEGLVGGGLGERLAAFADAVALVGRTSLPGAVLRVDADGRPRLESRPELVGLDVPATRAALALAAEDVALWVGPAGERGLPFANLACGGERPSFVGRGGLGARFGALGLKAIVFERGASTRAAAEGREELTAALLRSPRLAVRAERGSLELFAAQAARADAGALSAEAAATLLDEARQRGAEREGCRGCPTPCGWTFESRAGERTGARFNAMESLGRRLGLGGLGPALRLLAACDRIGADAKEVGARLAEEIEAGDGALHGDVAALEARALALVEGGAWPERAARCARERGPAVRATRSLAARLGQRVSTGGADPMRSFPFLVEDGGRALLERLCADVAPLPPRAHDPLAPEGKGRLVYWHENLVSGVDLTGFCAFSTAGLLSDAVCDLDTLAGWILPAALREACDDAWAALSPGRRLLAAGANLVLLRHAFDAGAPPRAIDEPAATTELAAMLDEYRRFRGLEAGGAPGAERLARAGSPGVLAPHVRAPRVRAVESAAVARPSEVTRVPAVDGRAELRVAGDAPRRLHLPLPATLLEVLRLAQAQEGAPRWLDGERPIPSVWRAGERLEPGDLVRDGDVLDLVTAISGG